VGTEILIFDTALKAAEACGQQTLNLLEEARRDRGIATIALSGGSTPRLMFQWMSKYPFEWRAIELFQVDERCVPPGDPSSNFRMIRESLQDSAPIEKIAMHRIQGELPPPEAATAYVKDVRTVLHLDGGTLPEFDVIQRGMGPDAHTASLFPGEPLIRDQTHIAAAVYVDNPDMPAATRHRVTLLGGVLERARHTLCLATGEEKAEALYRVLRGPANPFETPSQIASPDTTWYIDQAAASRL